MKDFPLNELLSAMDLDKIQESLDLILGHINRKLKFSPYLIRRVLPLVEAIPCSFVSSHPVKSGHYLVWPQLGRYDFPY